MYRTIQTNYFWFEMAKYCKQYVSNCSTCRRTKAYTVQKQGLLNPLLIPNRKWIDLLLDFFVKLPKYWQQNRVFQHIFMVIDWLTKRHLYEPLKILHTSKFIDAMYCHVFASYGFPLTIVNNQKGQMTAMLWRRLCKRYSINIKFSSAHHLEMDGQTKSANRVMKNYLRVYIAYIQDNWVDHLLMAKFAASNYVNTSTGITPFFADHRFHPWISIESPGMYKREEQQWVELLAADKIVAQ